MIIRMLAVASLVVAAAACADDSDFSDRDPSQANDVENPATQQTDNQTQSQAEGLVLKPNRLQCQADGPCSPSCDQGLVIDLHVPSGNCVTFDCSWNNSPDVGGCHP
jgi:hypothetical protein